MRGINRPMTCLVPECSRVRPQSDGDAADAGWILVRFTRDGVQTIGAVCSTHTTRIAEVTGATFERRIQE